MTRKQLTKIIIMADCPDQAADNILVAIEAERVGEVVLGEGVVKWYDDQIEVTFTKNEYSVCSADFQLIEGKKGQLIFKEQEGK